MNVKLVPALFIFLGSYLPLSLILLIQDVTAKSWLKKLCWNLQGCTFPELINPERSISLLLVCSISISFFFWVLKRLPADGDLVVIEAKTVPNDLINYVFPYVVSFMGLDLGDDGKFYGFTIFIFWMFLITYRSGQILMNPLLLATGWQLYELKIDTSGHHRNVVALSKTRVTPGISLKSCVIQGIYVLSKEEENGGS
ncbi:hypothetical protein [Xanthomonas campestris]|uniref:hypothetical protein n=2 Tax=Xanthomonas campestris TaxID=339 RepID=UPI00096E0F02|nr:hypothetical protein [Xanthomonas campestris]MCF8824567.1 hypothetical protein [Xanthomonas campestris pv. raphani]MEA9840144.1 hypothetical protein [Xanthomonas campestris pv. raphani]MEA9877433.1 hypothetical protein [Xanthomonas campestris pv. raphani]MEA9892238.1 hypothetical protein [Xanthomonas campestris pv. raphani]MEA9932992.1 hypothetical protein [Xanthomonas campestris pv. raphani]